MATKKTVLITGCSDGGLGAALAKAFHNSKWRVLATARKASKMASLQALGIELLELDVQSEESLKSCIEKVSQMTDNKLDMLINNAGGGYNMPISDMDMGSVRSVFELNVFSVIRTTQLFLPLIMANPSGSTIVNHTSVSSVTSGPFSAAYNASKAAMASFSDSMRLELAPFRVKVIDMKTARVHSNFFASIKTNDHATQLPEGSIYAFAKDIVEHALSGEPVHGKAMPQHVWASKVVKDLTQSNPPGVVWRGLQATEGWLSTFLPTWLKDPAFKKLAGLDKIETRLAKQQKK